MVLDRKSFDRHARRAQLGTLTEMAKFVGISQSTFWRIYHGERGAGGPNVWRILKAPWPEPQPTMEELFPADAA